MSATAEQIILDSNEHNITPSDNDLNSVILELRQANKLKNTQRLIQIYSSHVIKVTEKVGKRTRSFMLNLALLNDKPSHIRHIQPRLLGSTFALGLISFLTWYLKSKGVAFLSSSYTYAVIALLATSTIITAAMAIKSFTNSWVFASAQGRIPLITLFHNHPNKQQFNQFISEMINHIVMAKSELRLSRSQIMPLEVGEHRRLAEEGIISKNQYELAKNNILKGNSR